MPASGDGQEGSLVRRGPVFDLPASPESAGRSLVRIVDPAGLAVAWFDPGSACCLGFTVRLRRQDRTVWQPVLAVPHGQAEDARSYGCAVLAAAGVSRSRVMSAEPGDDWSRAGWRLRERDPTSVVLETALRTHGTDSGPDLNAVYGRLTAQLDDAKLVLALIVRNDGNVARPVAFGLRPVFASWLLTGSFQVLLQQGGQRISLQLPEGSGVGGLMEAPGEGQADTAAGDHLVWPGGALQIVVTGDEGVQYVEPQEMGVAGSVAVAVLGSPPGQPGLLVPGACAQMTVSIAALPVDTDTGL